MGNTHSQHRLSTHVSEFRPQRSETPPAEERDTTVKEPPPHLYKQLTTMSLNYETQLEATSCSGSAPTTIKPFDGTDPGYTVEEYLSNNNSYDI